MPTLFYLHWNEPELRERIASLEADGYTVAAHWSTETAAKIAEPYPDAVLISLDRLPAHGRAVAERFWEAKKRQRIPIIFVDGKPDKVADTRKKFPRAIYCPTAQLPDVLAQLL